MEIKRLTVEAGEIEKFKQQKQELERKLDVIQDLNAKKTGPVEVLDELSLIIPEKAWLTSLSNKGDNMVLEGSGSRQHHHCHLHETASGIQAFR
ncbi:MAG: PilN domain-containing protein [Desulfobacterales bacterium]|nr:PilN domain-containing protein [Desulfobacterales bacterium]